MFNLYFPPCLLVFELRVREIVLFPLGNFCVVDAEISLDLGVGSKNANRLLKYYVIEVCP